MCYLVLKYLIQVLQLFKPIVKKSLKNSTSFNCEKKVFRFHQFYFLERQLSCNQNQIIYGVILKVFDSDSKAVDAQENIIDEI